MKCFNHPELDATATCADCQKWLCKDCAGRYQEPVCWPCNQKRIDYERNAIFKDFWIMLVLGIVLTFLWIQLFPDRLSDRIGTMFVIVYFYIFFSLYNWWKFLNKITSWYVFIYVNCRLGNILFYKILFSTVCVSFCNSYSCLHKNQKINRIK